MPKPLADCAHIISDAELPERKYLERFMTAKHEEQADAVKLLIDTTSKMKARAREWIIQNLRGEKIENAAAMLATVDEHPVFTGKQEITSRVTGVIRGESQYVRNMDEAASLLADIRKSAQERLYVVATNRKGKILEVMNYGKGTRSAASVNPSEIIGRAVNIKGATDIYVAHNHPGGEPTPSKEDIALHGQMAAMAYQSALRLHPFVIGGTKYQEIDKIGAGEVRPVKPILRKAKIKTSERFIGVSKPDQKVVQTWLIAVDVKNRLVGEQAEGYLLLNNKNKAIGWWTPPTGVTYAEAARQFYGQVESHGVAAVIVFTNEVSPADLDSRVGFAEMIARGLHDVSVHDVIVQNKQSLADAAKLGNRYQSAEDSIKILLERSKRILYQEGLPAPFLVAQREQAFGHGHYFSARTALSDHYRALDGKGPQAETPAPANFLDWDKPLGEDLRAKAQAALAGSDRTVLMADMLRDPAVTGGDLYRAVAAAFGGDQREASLFLRDAGIDGARFVAGGAEGFVVFDESSDAEQRYLYQPYKDLGAVEKGIVDGFIAAHPERARLERNLKRLGNTPWGAQLVDAIIIRQALLDMIGGRFDSPAAQAFSARYSRQTGIVQAIQRRGEEGFWSYIDQWGFIGMPSKPGLAISSSFINCDPTPNCARTCYATQGNYAYHTPTIKSEINDLAVTLDPRRAAGMAARQYKAHPLFEAGRALRLGDKGDISKQWLEFINELNLQGVRVQVFTNRADLVRGIDPQNVVMLSVDESNRATADENQDLKMAYVYKGTEEIAWLQERSKHIQVILPIKIGSRLMSKEEIAKLPKNLRKLCCPVDAGQKSVAEGWNCGRCDINGGLGCFRGQTTGTVELTVDRAERAEEEIRRLADEIGGEDGRRLHEELDILLYEVRRRFDPGSEVVGEVQAEESAAQAKRAVKRGRAAAKLPRVVRQDTRGLVEHLFDATPKIIHLFERADFSTVLHETGHILLEMMYRSGHEDYLAVAKWCGVEDDKAYLGTGAWTEEQLERFAKGFELYCLEGSAPTGRLVKFFREIKTQLLAIYKSLKDTYFAGVPEISPDVRRIFDRWLATESELANDPVIEMAEWMRSQEFADDESGRIEQMKIEAEQAWRALHPSDTDQLEYDRIVELARKAVMPELAKRRQKVEKKLRADFMKEAEAVVADDPFYQMLQEITDAGGMHLRSVEGQFSREWMVDAMRKRPGLFTRKDGAVEADVMAAQYGYDSAEALVNELLSRPGRQEAIDNYFDGMWREYESTEHMNEADAYKAVLDIEIEIFHRLSGKRRPKARTDLKGIIRRQTGQVKTEDGRALAEQLRRDQKTARAAYLEAQQAARELTAAKLTALDEKRQEQLEKAKEKALDKIIALKEAHLERMKAVRENYRQTGERAKIHSRIGRLLKKKSMLPEFKSHLASILSQWYKLPRRLTPDPPERVFDALLTELEGKGFGNYVETVRALWEALPPPMPKGKLSQDQVEAIGDFAAALKMLERQVRLDQLLQAKIKVKDAVSEMTGSMINTWKPTMDERHPLAIQRKRAFAFTRLSEFAQKYWASLRKVEFIARALDGFKSDGPVWRRIYAPMNKAMDAELSLGEQKFAELKEAFAGFDRKWAQQKYTIAALNGEVMTKEQMIMAMLNSGNDGNRAAIVHGNNINKAALIEIADALSAREVDLIEKVWRIIDGLFPLLDQVHRQVTGVKLRKVDGRYFPLVFDRELSWKIGAYQTEQEMRNLFASEYLRASVAAGHRKARTGGKYAVDLSFDVIGRHVQQAIHDITHQAAVRDVQRLILEPDFRQAVTAVMGDKVYRQFPLWLQEIAKPVRTPKDGLEIIVGHLRSNMTIVAMGFKVLTALQNLFAYTQTMQDREIGSWRALKAIKQFYAHPWAQKQFVDESSVFMRNREKQWDREMATFYREFNPTEFRGWNRCREAFFGMMAVCDRAVAYPTWIAGYEAEYDRSQDHERAVAAGDMAVRRNQPISAAKDMADIQRGTEFKKALVMFYSFFSTFHNRMVEVWGERQLGRLNIVQLAQAHFLLLVLPSILSTLLYSRGDWDWLEQIRGLIRYALGGLPFFRDLANGLITDYDYQLTPIEGLGKEVYRVGQDIQGGRFDKLPKRAVNVSGYALGLPSQQMTTTMEGAYDLITGETSNPMRLLFREQKDTRR